MGRAPRDEAEGRAEARGPGRVDEVFLDSAKALRAVRTIMECAGREEALAKAAVEAAVLLGNADCAQLYQRIGTGFVRLSAIGSPSPLDESVILQVLSACGPLATRIGGDDPFGTSYVALSAAQSGNVVFALQAERRDSPFSSAEAETLQSLLWITARTAELALVGRWGRPESGQEAVFAVDSVRRVGETSAEASDLAGMLRGVLEAAVELTKADGGIIRLVAGHQLIASADIGGSEVELLRDAPSELQEQLESRAMAEGKVAAIDDAGAGHGYVLTLFHAGIRTLVCAPILSLSTRESIGALTVYRCSRMGAFGADERALLMALAGHAAAAVERSRAASEQRDATIEIAVLHEIATATSSLDRDEVLDIAAEKILSVTGASHCCFFLRTGPKGTIECAACDGLTEPIRQRLRSLRIPIDTLNDELWRRLEFGAEVVLPDPALTSPVLQRLGRLLSVQGAVLVPLIGRSGLIGALYLHSPAEAIQFDERRMRLLRAVCRQLGVAIERAQLFGELDRRVRELSALNRVSESIAGTLDLREMLDIALEETMAVLAAQKGSIMLMAPDGEGLRVEVARGLPNHIVRRAVVPVGEGVAGWVARHREVLLHGSIENDPRFRPVAPRPEVVSAISVPLVAKARVLGVLNVASTDKARQFTDEDLRTVSTIAGQLSVAIQNARLYEDERRVAQVTRASLAPKLVVEAPQLEIGWKHVPSSDVGGDCVDVIQLGDRRIGFVVSDVSGHGVTVAMHAAKGRDYVKALSQWESSPARVLQTASCLLIRETPPEMFVCLVYAVLDLQTGELAYANAGHVPPLRVSGSGDDVEELRETGFPLGLWADERYSEGRTTLEPGDLVLFYTDGVSEARRGAQAFGYHRLRSAAVRLRHRPAQEIADRIYRRLVSFCEGPPRDDVALLVVKFLGQPSACVHKVRS
ncbi:MAG: SpoIIE family protein phosphatase [Armatimonadota bacterium]